MKKIPSSLKGMFTSGKFPKDAPTVDQTGSVHANMMSFDLLLEASGSKTIRSINITHGTTRVIVQPRTYSS